MNDFLDELGEWRDFQLSRWDLARKNYEALGETLRREVHFGKMAGAMQYNPARRLSTGAKIDKKSIEARPCFLCKQNRPQEQLSEEIIPGWEILVNPYPIFPLHFTIADRQHVPQCEIPLEMASMAERLKGMTVFFNGAKAGASAPDHRHCQAVATSELPLMRYLEDGGDPKSLPFKLDYRRITPDSAGMRSLAGVADLKGIDKITGEEDYRLVNSYMWIGKDGILNSCTVFRSAHRPECYTSDSENGCMVSPGAIDMAGILILPRKEDFERITQADVQTILSEVGLPDNES